MTIQCTNKNRERVIDLDGPDGNVFNLLGIAKVWSEQLGWSVNKVQSTLTRGSYTEMVVEFDELFGSFVVLETTNKEILNAMEETNK